MADPVLLFVETEYRAQWLQRDHDPRVILVMPMHRRPAIRASAVIVEMPRMLESVNCPERTREAFRDFMEWVPTRLVPISADEPCRSRITIL